MDFNKIRNITPSVTERCCCPIFSCHQTCRMLKIYTQQPVQSLVPTNTAQANIRLLVTQVCSLLLNFF